tara:strand:+ start:188 stop:412 length:225 start_codon:yes stop_codon:yes gene_type:complete
MNEEFKEGLTDQAKLKICEQLRECIIDIMHARDKFKTIVTDYDLPVSDLTHINSVSSVLGDVEILTRKVEEDAS